MEDKELHHHFIFHKPYSCLSQFVSNESRKKKKGLIDEFHNFPNGLMAIGRLDKYAK